MKSSYFFYWLFACYFIFLCGSCESTQDSTQDITEPSQKEIEPSLSWEDKIRRKIEVKLGIKGNEIYDFQLFKSHLNRDTLIDAVVLINREQFALEEAKKENKEKFLEYMGYTGPHNHVFVQLGNSDQLIQAPPVGSSIFHPLSIEFESITMPGQNDFFVSYRSRNSLFRNYYTVRSDKIFLTFNCPEFDLIGEKEPEVYSIQHKESTVRTAKDIALYYGEIVDYSPSKIEDINSYTPKEIVSTDELFVYFIFDEKTKKYKTPFKREQRN
jgi:hypothetical protein